MRTRPNRSLLRKTIIAGGGSSITTPTAFWNLDQGSGSTRTDSCSDPCHLSVNGTVNQVSGKINNAASVASGLNYLNNFLPPSKMTTSGTFSFAGWFYLDNSAGGTLAGNGTIGLGSGWKITGSTTHLILSTFQSIGVGTSLDVSVSLSTSTWYFIAGYYNSSELGISIDGGSFTTGSGSAPASGSNLTLLNDSSGGGNALQGRLDEFAYWVGYKITSDEKDALYNSGNGKTFNGSSWV